MAFQFSTAWRNAILDLIETQAGVSARLHIRSASAANCAAAGAGTLLADVPLPSDWMNAAASGQKTFLGTWTDTSADATGTAVQFRLMDTTGTTCTMQGTVTATGGGGDMTLDTVSLVATQPFTITAYTLNAPGA